LDYHLREAERPLQFQPMQLLAYGWLKSNALTFITPENRGNTMTSVKINAIPFLIVVFIK